MKRIGRRTVLAAALLTLPLLQTAMCVARAERAIINGFFDGLTPVLIDRTVTDFGEHLAGGGEP